MEHHMEELMDQYVLGQLQGKALADFEAQLKKDPELNKKVRLHQEAQNLLETIEEVRLKKKLKNFGQQTTPSTQLSEKPSLFATWRWWAGAAAAVALLGVAFWWFSSTPSHTPQDLFAQYYSFQTLSATTRNATAQKTDTLALALQRYNNKAFDSAIPILQQFSSHSKARLALGIAYLERQEPQQTLSTLEPLIIQNDPLFLEQALWYSSLAYLQLNQTEEALHLLNKITPRFLQNVNGQSLIEELQK